MKGVKIILVVVVLGAIGFFAFKWTLGSKNNNKNGNTEFSENNQFVQKISEETDSLKTLPKTDFSIDYYHNIQAELQNYFNKRFLGSDSIENKQAFENLSKTLFATYVPKFVEKAYYVFGQPSWENSNIQLIRTQINKIKSNPFFDAENSTFVSKFKEINQIISQYYKVAAFVSRCRNFPSGLVYSVSSRFPIDEVKEKITKAKQYLNNNLGNQYVNNVTWLQNALKEVPRKMYIKNIDFLKWQVQHNSNRYKEFESQADYSKQIYQPLKQSIDEFDNKIYGVSYSEFNNDYKAIKGILDKDNKKAGNYFRVSVK